MRHIASATNTLAPQPLLATANAIRVCNVSKMYKLYKAPSDLIAEALFGKQRHTEHWALRDVSLDVERGTVTGIIGPNGAGKSTLLKIVAGTLQPSSGTVAVDGKISAILELGTGFHDDYSGRENIVLGGMCAGMSREVIMSKVEGIIAFSELEAVIDQPFKTYSSGMRARLTFATAISVEPDIMIIDEALAAGDNYFVAKCMKRVRQICEGGATVLFVSHGTNLVAQLCSRAIWIEGGRVRAIGSAVDVAKSYDYETHVRISGGSGRVIELVQPGIVSPAEIKLSVPVIKPVSVIETVALITEPATSANSTDQSDTERSLAAVAALSATETSSIPVFRRGPVEIRSVKFLDGEGKERQGFRASDTLVIRVKYAVVGDLPDETVGMAVGIERASDFALITQFSTCNVMSDADYAAYDEAAFRQRARRSGVIEARLTPLQLLEGHYLVSIGLIPNIPYCADFWEYHHRSYRLSVPRDGFPSGAIFYPRVEWNNDVWVEGDR